MDLEKDLLSPDKTLTKICIDCDCNSGEVDREDVALEGVDMMSRYRIGDLVVGTLLLSVRGIAS